MGRRRRNYFDFEKESGLDEEGFGKVGLLPCFSMKVFVSHSSALEYWRRFRSLNGATAPIRSSSQQSVFYGGVRAAREAVVAVDDACGLLGRPLHLFVRARQSHRSFSFLVFHACSKELPRKAFVRVAGDVYVSSPELCFLQAASFLSFVELVMLGYELCGKYVLPEDDARGFCGCGQCFTSSARLASFAERAVGIEGRSCALRALKYVEDGSASPMETALAALLRIPRAEGGYGLPFVSMNRRVDVGREGRKVSSSNFYVCDLFWASARLAVEYDSDTHHAHSQGIARDSKRRNALESMGIKVVSVTRAQLLDQREMDRVARILRKHLGVRINIPNYDYQGRQRRLRSVLLRFGG